LNVKPVRLNLKQTLIGKILVKTVLKDLKDGGTVKDVMFYLTAEMENINCVITVIKKTCILAQIAKNIVI
jgi:uncharacterized Zn ribbon protein